MPPCNFPFFCNFLCLSVFSLHGEEAGQAFASATTSPARPSSAAAGAASAAAAGEPGRQAPAPGREPARQGAARAPRGLVPQGRVRDQPAGGLPRRGRRLPQGRPDRRCEREREARPRQLGAGIHQEAQASRAARRKRQGISRESYIHTLLPHCLALPNTLFILASAGLWFLNLFC